MYPLLLFDLFLNESEIQKSDFATEFAENIGSLYSRIIPKSPERLALVMAVMKLDDKRFPLPYINHLIANQLFKEQNYQDARYYYLNSAAYGKSNAADMLIEQHQKEGHPNEIDLFITQFVLQTLGRARAATVSSANTLGTDKDPSTIDLLDIKTRSIEHGYAITVFTAYVTRHPSIGVQRPMFPFPLLNFIYLLLIAVAR